MTADPLTRPTRTPKEVRAFYDTHRTVRHYVTQADGSPLPLPEEHLDAILHAAQRAPTDATAQLYSFIRLVSPEVRARVAELTTNAHIATASEAFVVCLDVRRVGRVLEVAGQGVGHWPAIAVHFGIGDAVLAGQNLLTAAEMLGYQGCWIGGVLNGLEGILDVLDLPAGVLPFAALTLGLPAEEPPLRPRLPRPLVVHEDRYRDGTEEELRQGIEVMNPIAARRGQPGDWVRLLRAYFAPGGSMEKREPGLVAALKRQGLWAGGE
ncbi:NADPH-dependent oxidoreductase [Deinococcus metallilatus]|uniref:NADPH-dependent oxidoreductase n=1 Tax=Deinococcus metallilatus TaxID=1211322 RepID=A0AAJ5JYB8_9DEIO|nr:nitroreductase family protein [Deinococcus metallilatus]MBB5295113.1 nitroreductase [Deinococcus metallilatus]QBY08708.1 NADPH-dependent oxidoreductase [Deinococcus metallilatus]RXJ10587.1 NADPH-dependent oxidoreductase [Deinococcus metallilatus]TLK26558.1 NADPH-dependent oxidoreductase [Deinococcus metallilatus]GMA14885.1 NADPH-dependent oxidoreductase [Deinococcus metallilatus]